MLDEYRQKKCTRRGKFFFSFTFLKIEQEEKNIFNYRCLDNKLKISTDLLLSNTSREVTSTSVFFFYRCFCCPFTGPVYVCMSGL